MNITLPMLICASLGTPAVAATLLVSNTNDSGAGSLREAIQQNNASGGGNTIVFPNTVTGAITLINGQIVVSNSVTIVGPGAKMLAINGNNSSRVFHFRGGSNAVAGLMICNGYAKGADGTESEPALSERGGGILNEAVLTRVIALSAIRGSRWKRLFFRKRRRRTWRRRVRRGHGQCGNCCAH